MALDVNDAPKQREFGAIIPDGTFVHLIMKLIPGGISMPRTGDAVQDELDWQLFHAGKSDPNALGLSAEYTVLDGPHKQGKVWDNFMTVTGGQVDASGTSKGWLVTKAKISAMINSACGLDPNDQSPEAKQQRIMRGFADLDGIEFWAKLGVEAGGIRPQGGDYPDKNTIALIIESDRPEYAALKAGQEVEPQPRGSRKGANGSAAVSPVTAAQAAKPAWQRAAAPAQVALAAPPAPVAPPAAAIPATGPKWLQNKTA